MNKAGAELESGCKEQCTGARSPDAVSWRSKVTWVATLLLLTLTLCILSMQLQAPATYLAAPFIVAGNQWEDVKDTTHASLSIEGANVGDVFCNINGTVEPVAIIDGKLFDGENIPVTWPGECAMITVAAEWITNRTGVNEIVVLSKEKNAEYDTYKDLQTLAASQAALKGKQHGRELFCSGCTHRSRNIPACSGTVFMVSASATQFYEAFCKVNNVVAIVYCIGRVSTTMKNRDGKVLSVVNDLIGNAQSGEGASSKIETQLAPGQSFRTYHQFTKEGCCLKRTVERRLDKIECKNADFTPYDATWTGRDQLNAWDENIKVKPAIGQNCKCP